MPTDQRITDMLARHNTVRGAPLALSDLLCLIAQKYAKRLYETGNFSHNFEGTLTDRLKRDGYKYSAAGENIARQSANVPEEQIFQGWMASSGHRANILSTRYTEAGFGFFGFDSVWVANFAKPMGINPVPPPTPLPSGRYLISAAPLAAKPGEQLTVSFTNPGGTRDWIGLSRVGSPANAHGAWAYIAPGSGTVLFDVPAAEGNYEARYYIGNGYQIVATSAPIVVASGPAPIPVPIPNPPPPVSPDEQVGSIVVGGSTFDLFARRRM